MVAALDRGVTLLHQRHLGRSERVTVQVRERLVGQQIVTRSRGLCRDVADRAIRNIVEHVKLGRVPLVNAGIAVLDARQE